MKITSFIIFCTCLIVTGNVAAEARRDAGAADPMRKMQYMLRQLSQEKSKLEAENGKFKIDLKTEAEEKEKLQAKLEKLNKKLDKSKDNNLKLVSRVKQDNERMKEMIARYRETVNKLQTANRDNQLLVNAVSERNQWIDQCQSKNSGMYTINIELMQRYRNKDFSDDALEKEAFTGLVAVELENQEQEYKFRLSDLQTPKFVSETN
ncbi:hypothetical protein MNBD_GAMMA25-270 [hydrothermal vent metagenome]|uniref:Uncharacterized protein n=1 Tax=hydrothermal vent metagenome TaxID=652676 RepID=A0A3B1BVV6_9ZZZZ